jgi:serine phosphatase RsbU (regulator of sigma subunit)
MWVGLVDNLGDMNRDNTFYLNKDDVLLLYTDGLTEARDQDNDIFSLKRLKSILKDSGRKSVEEIKNDILERFSPFKSDDDVTIIIAKRL